MDNIFDLILKRNNKNFYMVECASELIYIQLKSAKGFLLKQYKTNLISIFKSKVSFYLINLDFC